MLKFYMNINLMKKQMVMMVANSSTKLDIYWMELKKSSFMYRYNLYINYINYFFVFRNNFHNLMEKINENKIEVKQIYTINPPIKNIYYIIYIIHTYVRYNLDIKNISSR